MSYSVKEIIDIAIGIEEAGHAFYTGCGFRFSENELKDMFEFLAREELAHRDLFRSMSGGAEPPGIFTDEYFAYLRAIGGRIFDPREHDIERVLAGITGPLDAIREAFQAEKESILFYAEMKGLYREGGETAALLDRIIQEERRHVMTLTDVARGLMHEGDLT